MYLRFYVPKYNRIPYEWNTFISSNQIIYNFGKKKSKIDTVVNGVE